MDTLKSNMWTMASLKDSRYADTSADKWTLRITLDNGVDLESDNLDLFQLLQVSVSNIEEEGCSGYHPGFKY